MGDIAKLTIKFIDGDVCEYEPDKWSRIDYIEDSAMFRVIHGKFTDMFQTSQIKSITFEEVK